MTKPDAIARCATRLAALWCLALTPLQAQQPAAIWSAANAIQVDSLSLSDGLSDSTIFSISQDQRGRIWLGSAAGGANVYDGYEVHYFVHDPNDPTTLSNSAAGEVLATRSGVVLMGTWGGGLNRLSAIDGQFERLNPSAAPTHIQVLIEDSAGQVWVGSADSGLYRLDQHSGQISAVSRPDGESYGRVWSLAAGPDGQLWLANAEGVFAVRSGELLEAPRGGWINHPRALLYAHNALWIGDDETVYRQRGDAAPVPVVAELPLVNTLALGPKDEILIGTLSGIRAANAAGEATAPFGATQPLLFPERNIRRVHVDRGGVSWVATREAGALKVQPTVSGFDGFRLETDLDTADTMLELAPDDVLIGSRRGLWRLTKGPEGNQFRQIPGSEAHPISRLRRQGEVVLVGTRMGIYRFDPRSEELSVDPRFAEVVDFMVTTLRVGDDGGVDIGTWTGGMFRYGPEGLRARLAPDGDIVLPDASIADIEPDGAGGIWVGLWESGVAHLKSDGSLKLIDRAQLGLEGTLHDLLLADGRLWVATSFGLSSYDLQRSAAEQLTLIPDYPNTAVQRLAHGGGRLWAATTRGVIALNLSDRSMTRFGTADGLVVDEFFARSGDEGENGRVYFGGLGGFVSFLPEQVALSLTPPEAAVVGAWADGEPLPLSEPLSVPPLVASLRLRFIAADYRLATANRFRWRLVNDRGHGEWSPVSATPEALLTGLKPGRFGFELQAASGNGLWNREPMRLPLQVLPAWWQTLWGQLGLLVAALLLGWLFSYWYSLRIRLRNRALRREVDRQTEALRKANASLAIAAFTDYLTGLLNRRGFLSRVDELPPAEGEYYALVDADNFKSFNDRYGHDVGDLVLQHVAECLSSSIRFDEDLAARWGGEEFILCVRDADAEEAAAVAERVREAIASQPLHAERELPPITVTIGLAPRLPGEDAIDAINRADEYLLQGKAQGKNRVIAHAA